MRLLACVAAGALGGGIAAGFVAGVLAISALLRCVRTRSYNVFVGCRLVLAAVDRIGFPRQKRRAADED